ncbi:MAG: AAA family ATPase [Bacteroidetes bacterium]|nr:MAG: AAA family ATPase [Bacteroidota bacterium]
MIRFFTEYLIDWKSRKDRKPLIVRGARQVGKTYTIEKFGKENFNDIIIINFEETPDLKLFFQTNDVIQIIQNLEIYYGKKIDSTNTLLFLDEIQTCPEAIVTLRYFYEKTPNLHLIAAGSLLDHVLNDLQYSMPVGRVEFSYMYPLSFYEFLIANNKKSLIDFLKSYAIKQEIPLPIHYKLMELVRLYFFIGGMPEAVNIYMKTKSLIDVERIHENILKSLEFDFSKYGTRTQQQIMTKLLKYVPKALGQKFKYVNFDNSLRSDAIRKSLNLLSMSKIIYLIHNSKANGIPLEHDSVEKIFKPLFFDIGLSNHILKLRLTDIENLVLNNEGSLAEQFVGQELLCRAPYFMENSIYYWLREQRNSEAEIDYMTQIGNQIIPIEVKAGKTGTLKSLQVFISEKKLDIAIRFNADVPSTVQVDTSIKIAQNVKKVNFQLISLPFYLVGEFHRFLNF